MRRVIKMKKKSVGRTQAKSVKHLKCLKGKAKIPRKKRNLPKKNKRKKIR